ncbi:unnamed protein product [Bursaphelenchus okinawaensis]|uniref:MSP domain-containing protein n=1 Tax=Bursaphelenchus okinawaensis TaxID=465554 RepID=A0A811K4H1_9BILA|nr:unnamed protein product [Bursaphelenchus okinawaensis]CAG9092256.1 unnamed protein product [Bursaphelenchus okinawaensis]
MNKEESVALGAPAASSSGGGNNASNENDGGGGEGGGAANAGGGGGSFFLGQGMATPTVNAQLTTNGNGGGNDAAGGGAAGGSFFLGQGMATPTVSGPAQTNAAGATAGAEGGGPAGGSFFLGQAPPVQIKYDNVGTSAPAANGGAPAGGYGGSGYLGQDMQKGANSGYAAPTALGGAGPTKQESCFLGAPAPGVTSGFIGAKPIPKAESPVQKQKDKSVKVYKAHSFKPKPKPAVSPAKNTSVKEIKESRKDVSQKIKKQKTPKVEPEEEKEKQQPSEKNADKQEPSDAEPKAETPQKKTTWKGKQKQPEMNLAKGEIKSLVTDPEKLVFTYPYDKPQLVNVKITNVSHSIVAYKVMASVPQHYRVRGKQGALYPGESEQATIRLEPLKDLNSAIKENHRILIQNTPCKSKTIKKDFWKEVERPNCVRVAVKLLLEGEEKSKLKEDEYVPTSNDGIIVEPNRELVFQGPFDDIVTAAICVINNTDKFMYIKAMVTNPIPFRVRPNFSCINPRAMQVLAAMVEPIRDLSKIRKKKNKFMIEYTEGDEAFPNFEEYWSSCSKFQSVKLKARFNE